MTARYMERTTRNHSRQRGLGSEAFDRLMDSRERRSYRHRASASSCYVQAFGEQAEIERRSLMDVAAPTRS